MTTHDTEIKSMSDERRDVYRELRELSANPLDVLLAMPRNRLQPTVEVKEDGTEEALRNVSTTLRQWLLDFRLGFLPLPLVD